MIIRGLSDGQQNQLVNKIVTAAVQPSDLLCRGDILLGETLVRPVSRELHGVGGGASVEPRVMQVLLALVDAKGEVVTRAQLIRQCWNGQIVSEDAISRAIGEVRRLARTVAGGAFSVETITKTGYRLVGASVVTASIRDDDSSASLLAKPQLSRRVLISVSVLAAVSAAFVDRRAMSSTGNYGAASLIDPAMIALRHGRPQSDAKATSLMRRAVVAEPTNPEAWGKLALAYSAVAEHAGPEETAIAVEACQAASRRAFALDASQSDAHVALALLQPSFGDWKKAEERLTGTLAVAPNHPTLLGALGVLMAQVGRMRAASDFFDLAIEIEPLSPVLYFRRTYQLWNEGRIGEADRNVDRALELWPRHPGLWNVRLILFAFTGRCAAAAAMLQADAAARPPEMPAKVIELWRISLNALASRQTGDVDQAVKAQLTAASTGGPGAINAILVLSQLHALDEAFAVADGYLLRHGPLVGLLTVGPDQFAVNDQRRRKTMMLFTAATAPLRADRRFAKLCANVGLVEYWRAAKIGPDYTGGSVIA